MKKIFFISTLFMLTMCFASSHSYAQEDWTGNLNILLGQKALNSDDWDDQYYTDIDLSKQTENYINVDFRPKSWPISFVIGYLKSANEDRHIEKWYGTETLGIVENDSYVYYDVTDDYTYEFRAEGSTRELRFGVKKIWEPTSRMRPYISGGLAMIRAKLKFSEFLNLATYTEFNRWGLAKDSDNTIGTWVAGGVYWTFAEHYNIGAELGYSKAKVTLFDKDTQAGGVQALFLVGYHW